MHGPLYSNRDDTPRMNTAQWRRILVFFLGVLTSWVGQGRVDLEKEQGMLIHSSPKMRQGNSYGLLMQRAEGFVK